MKIGDQPDEEPIDEPKSDYETASGMLAYAVREAAQILEVAAFRESQVADLHQLADGMTSRWRADMIAKIKEGEEGDPLPTPEEFTADLTSRVFGEMKLSANILNAASLVLVHSLFDALLSDLLRVTSIAGRDLWTEQVKSKKVSISEASELPVETIVGNAIEAELWEKGQQSLGKRMAALFNLCKMKRQRDGFKGAHKNNVLPEYVFDGERLEKIDRMRQDIVHRKGMDLDIQDTIDDSVAFLWLTLINAILLVAQCFKLTVDLEPATRSRLAPRKWTIILIPGGAKVEG